MKNKKPREEKKTETRLQNFTNKFNQRLDTMEKQGYSKRIKDNLKCLAEMRDGLFDAYHDPQCYDKNEIKQDIIEFTKLIIRHNNIAQKHLNPHVVMPSVKVQLNNAFKTDENLKKIFHDA